MIITTFRRHEMLGELLAALSPQAVGRPAEIIVVDNCPDSSAEEVAAAHPAPGLRYIREPRSGVVHARNCGVAAARGEYVVFLDDDEVPAPGWLDAWLSQADGRTDASFGRIVPRLLAPCPKGLAHQIDRTYGRDLGRATGRDISNLWAYLGTGNSMFHKARCLGQQEPFEARFNQRGGEDVWLIRNLARQGHRLLWNHAATVEELVPPDRMSLSFLEQRRFNQGQLRGILAYGDGGTMGLLRVSVWMAAGAIQFLGFKIAALLAGVLLPHQAPDLHCRAAGGLGKMMWRSKARVSDYAGMAGPLSAPSG